VKHHVMSMVFNEEKKEYRYIDWGRFDDINDAIQNASENGNRQIGFQGRYFVVSEQEYQEYWKRVVS
jgi:hypothetical protein